MDEHFLGWARGGYSRLAGRSQGWVFLVSDGCSQKGRFIVKALTWMSTFWAGQGGGYFQAGWDAPGELPDQPDGVSRGSREEASGAPGSMRNHVFLKLRSPRARQSMKNYSFLMV